MKRNSTLFLFALASSILSSNSEEKILPAPTEDHVGFPQNYIQSYRVLRTVNKPEEQKIVTVYGNRQAASVTNSMQLPYPYGSVIVMETASTVKDSQEESRVDQKTNLTKGKVIGLHVMRREKGFGEAYGNLRAGEWEFVEYKPDGNFITPPQKSATCAACHAKVGPKRDFVYKGGLADGK